MLTSCILRMSSSINFIYYSCFFFVKFGQEIRANTKSKHAVKMFQHELKNNRALFERILLEYLVLHEYVGMMGS